MPLYVCLNCNAIDNTGLKWHRNYKRRPERVEMKRNYDQRYQAAKRAKKMVGGIGIEPIT